MAGSEGMNPLVSESLNEYEVNKMTVTVFGMHTCPFCDMVRTEIDGNSNYDFIDIGSQIGNMKQFIQLRDSSPVFDETKEEGKVGVPCFVMPDGSITLSPEEAGLPPYEEMGQEKTQKDEPAAQGAAGCFCDML